jgi:D-glycero-D-manno-heptose 1,7-bisphosphate phosphatase
MRKRVVFLDRDGTLAEDLGPVARFEDLRIFSWVPDTLRTIQDYGYGLVIVTNQSGVANGKVSLMEVTVVHRRLCDALAADGVHLLGVLCCPHHPHGTVPPFAAVCHCRKPKPGLLLQAAWEFDIDLGRSWMVGDNITDLQAGWAAGCRVALVMTGHGRTFVEGVRNHVPLLESLRQLPWVMEADG